MNFTDGVPPRDMVLTLNADGLSLSDFRRRHGEVSPELTSTVSEMSMANCRAEFGPFVNNFPLVDCQFDNCVASGLAGLTSPNRLSQRNTYSNCKIGDMTQAPSVASMTLWGTEGVYNGVTFYQDVVVQGSGHIFDGCKFAGALTLAAESSGVFLSDVVVNGAFTDSGTDNAGTIF